LAWQIWRIICFYLCIYPTIHQIVIRERKTTMAALGGLLPGLGLANFFGVPDPADEQDPQKKIAAMARQAVIRGAGESAGVTPIKMKSDQSGSTGMNDYYSALGYEA
jgi:hypothetical protein